MWNGARNNLSNFYLYKFIQVMICRMKYPVKVKNVTPEDIWAICLMPHLMQPFDLGVNAIGSLITRNERLKKEWEETVKAENVFQTQISTVSEINDFYSDTSFDGAMDPKGMRFDGIGCMRKKGNDTVFYISCHIDRTKIDRIINHSKFELVLDTLIISPEHSNLPNTTLGIPFSFEERKNFTLSMKIKIISSWMNEIVQLQKNQNLANLI